MSGDNTFCRVVIVETWWEGRSGLFAVRKVRTLIALCVVMMEEAGLYQARRNLGREHAAVATTAPEFRLRPDGRAVRLSWCFTSVGSPTFVSRPKRRPWPPCEECTRVAQVSA